MQPKLVQFGPDTTSTFEDLCVKLDDKVFERFRDRLRNAEIIIWDLDGTILNTEDIWTEIHARAAEDLKLAATPEQLGDICGLALWKNKGIVKEKLDISADETNQFIMKVIEYGNNSNWKAHLKLRPGIQELLSSFHEEGRVQVILTSSETERALQKLSPLLEIQQYFGSAVYGCDRTPTTKPNPKTHGFVLTEHGIPPEKALALEDSRYGIASATGARILTVAVKGTEQAPDITKSNLVPYKGSGLVVVLDSHTDLIGIRDAVCPKRIIHPSLQDIEWFS